MAFYAHDFGAGVLALLLLVAWWRARSSSQPARNVALVLWAAGGTFIAWVIAHYGLKPLIAERRPYIALHHVEVLLPRTTGYSFPSGHATFAGGVIVGLWLVKDKLLAWAATILGLLLAFGRVYVGMHYPGDVLGGLAFGGLLVLILMPPAVAVLTRFDTALLKSKLFAPLVAARGKPGRVASIV